MMKLTKLLFTMNPDVHYRIIVVNEHNDILEDVRYSYRLPALTDHYQVINIKPVYEAGAPIELYIQIIVKEIFK